MKKVIVTGANGFLGSYLLPKLVRSGYEVTAISRSLRGSQSLDPVRWVSVNLFDYQAVKQCFDLVRPDLLIHLAWCTENGQFWSSAKNFTWSDATAKLLHVFKDAGGRKVVIAGTCAEYDWKYSWLMEEVTPTNPASVYGKCKDSTRQYAQYYGELNNIETIWARIFFPYGPGESRGKLIPSALASLLKNEPIECSHGEQYRDFIHIDDVALALNHLVNLTGVSGIFNVASSVPLKLKTLMHLSMSYFTDAFPPNFGAVAVASDEPMLVVGDNRKLVSTGWQPKITIEDGIRQYIEFLRT